MLSGHTTIHCCYICDGAQTLCLDHWLGYEPSCCCLRCESFPFLISLPCLSQLNQKNVYNSWFFHVQGIVSSSIAYYVQGLVMQKRGPVFVTAFSPLMMIIVAIMGSFILAEKIFLGG